MTRVRRLVMFAAAVALLSAVTEMQDALAMQTQVSAPVPVDAPAPAGTTDADAVDTADAGAGDPPLIAFSSPQVTWTGPATRTIEYGVRRKDPRIVIVEDLFSIRLRLPSGAESAMQVKVRIAARPSDPYPAQTAADIDADIASHLKDFPRSEYLYHGPQRIDGALFHARISDAQGKKNERESSLWYTGHARGRRYTLWADFPAGAIPMEIARDVMESVRLPDPAAEQAVALFDRFATAAVSEAGFLTHFGRLLRGRPHKFQLESLHRIWFPWMPQTQRGDYYMIEYVLPDTTISLAASCMPVAAVGRDAQEAMLFGGPYVSKLKRESATELAHGELRQFSFRRAALFRNPVAQRGWTMLREGVLYHISTDNLVSDKEALAFQATLDSPELRCAPLADALDADNSAKPAASSVPPPQ